MFFLYLSGKRLKQFHFQLCSLLCMSQIQRKP